MRKPRGRPSGNGFMRYRMLSTLSLEPRTLQACLDLMGVHGKPSQAHYATMEDLELAGFVQQHPLTRGTAFTITPAGEVELDKLFRSFGPPQNVQVLLARRTT